jgi:hypothetical protein
VLGQNAKGVTTTLVDNTVDKNTGAFRTYNPSTDDYNYGGLSYIQREAVRYTAGSFINFDVNDHTNVYSEFMFARNTSTALYAGHDQLRRPALDCSGRVHALRSQRPRRESRDLRDYREQPGALYRAPQR